MMPMNVDQLAAHGARVAMAAAEKARKEKEEEEKRRRGGSDSDGGTGGDDGAPAEMGLSHRKRGGKPVAVEVREVTVEKPDLPAFSAEALAAIAELNENMEKGDDDDEPEF